MLTLQEIPVRPATPAPETLRCPNQPSSARPPTHRLRNLEHRLLHVLATAATITGLTLITTFSAQAAHDLGTGLAPAWRGTARRGRAVGS